MTERLPLSELVASGIRLRPAEAVAIVGEICRQRAARVLPGLPSVGVIRLTPHGEITIEGPVPAGEDAIARAAQLLAALLPDFDAPAEYRASGALRLVIARGLGTLDLPPFSSLEDFCAALVRFSSLDARETVASLVDAWNHARAAALPAIPAPVADATPVAAVDPFERALLKDSAPAHVPAADLGAPPDEAVAAAPVPRRARRVAEFAAWLAAPAAAALLGYVLALPFAPDRNDAADSRIVQTAPVASVTPSPAPPPQVTRAADAVPDARETPPSSPTTAPHVIQAFAYSPSYASSGAVYFHDQRTGASALKLAETSPDGAVTKVTSILDDRALNFHPRPSPDGTRIAFDSDRDGVRGVYVADADGTNAHRISGDGFASVPSWSPDGRRVAFVRAEPSAPKVWNLWVADADGSDLRRLTHHRVGQAWGGSWFPDGARIAYSVETRLTILDLTTGRTRVAESPVPGRLVRTPAVSPDGNRIVFQVHHDGTWLMDVRTGAMRRVLADPTAEEYTWAPDGRHVAFHSHRSGAWSIWVVAI
jgi:hypothetical protein